MASIAATNEEAAVARLEDTNKPLHVFYTLPFREVTLVATWLANFQVLATLELVWNPSCFLDKPFLLSQ